MATNWKHTFAHAGSELKRIAYRKVPSDMHIFQPYWGKPAVRNDREGRGNVGIIRSPVRATILLACGGRSAMIVPTATVKTNVAEECAERELSFAWIMQCLLIPNPTGGAAFSRLRGMIGGHDLLPKLDLRQADSL